MELKDFLLEDLVDTSESYEKSISKLGAKGESTDRSKIPPGHRMKLMSEMDRHKRRYGEVQKCAASALRFVRKSVNIMQSYERSIARLQKEMENASYDTDRRRTSKKVRSRSRFATKCVQTMSYEEIASTIQSKSPQLIDISSDEEVAIEKSQHPKFIVDMIRRVN